MKKLLTVLCVAACGIGAAAQAQKNVAGRMAEYANVPGMMQKITTNEMMPAQGSARLMQSADAVYDTLRWHPEYISEDCDSYYSLMIWGNYQNVGEVFAADVVWSPYGATWNGTGEVGASYQTAGNEYLTYAQRDLSTGWVVGAWGIAYRVGAASVWERVDISGFDSVSEVNGVLVPDMPYKVKGYPIVESQTAIADYYDLFAENKRKDISIVMPLSKDDATESSVGYLKYRGSRIQDDGSPWPLMSNVGGMFEEAFPAGKNFGISIEAQLTNDATYDSLWNWSLIAKPGTKCAFVDAWSSWQRLNFSEPDKRWVWLANNDGSAINVSLPLDAEEGADWGFAPADCPQKNSDSSLYVYAFSVGLGLKDGSHFMPYLYPIIQYGAAANEKDTYAQTVSVYPLPATDKVTIVALDPIRKVEIYNMAGALLKHISMNDNVLEYDITSYAPGTYIARITTDKGVASKKLLVK